MRRIGIVPIKMVKRSVPDYTSTWQAMETDTEAQVNSLLSNRPGIYRIIRIYRIIQD